MLCASFVVHSSTGKCFVLQSLHKALPSTTLYYKACTKHFPVLLCTTKLAQTTSQYYCVLQRGSSLYYKACRKHFPVLLCTTKPAQTRSSTTVYYKARTNTFPVLLCTTKLAQTTSQYYCVLQNLHKHVPVLLCTTNQSSHKHVPSTTVYYTACTNYFPVLLCASFVVHSSTGNDFVL